MGNQHPQLPPAALSSNGATAMFSEPELRELVCRLLSHHASDLCAPERRMTPEIVLGPAMAAGSTRRPPSVSSEARARLLGRAWLLRSPTLLPPAGTPQEARAA